MSYTHPTAAFSSNLQLIINTALKAYEERTKNDLVVHPLAAQLQACDSPGLLLVVLQEQVRRLDHSRIDNGQWIKWRGPAVNVLVTFAATVGTINLIFLIFVWRIKSPVSAILVAIGILLTAFKDSRKSQDTLQDIFERIKSFFIRLEIYAEVPPSIEMMDIVVPIMVEVLYILGFTAHEMNQGQMKRTMMKLPVIRTNLENAIYRLDKLTREEAHLVIAQNLRATHTVGASVRGVTNKVIVMNNMAGSASSE
ncbi:hypothetical protein BJV77DRAFT_312828 [Russula vinacea]|nr:hypothetical protein BJV77DRAFT_312828 [Russula vinacea]